MRKYIEDQLKNCAFVDLTKSIKKDENTFLIPKYTKPKYDIGKCYLIKLAATIVNNPNSVIATNWNAGSFPKNQYMKAYVSKSKGKMIYIDCLSYDYINNKDLADMWSGWVSLDDLTQLAILN